MAGVPGWRPGAGNTRPERGGAMSTPDPNADLIGLTWPVDGGAITVTGSAAWNPAYVLVDTPEGPSCRVAAQVRRRKELQ